jgi:hypothetical protein
MIRNVAFALLFTLVAAEAHAASYLFGLTEREIDEILSHYYPKGYDRDAVLRQMAEPFDCRNVGDLCREVGEEYAHRMLEAAWVRARRRAPLEMIDRAAQQQLEDLALRWFERNYPDGVPERDPYWGVFAATTPAACDDTVSATSGDFRVTHTSRRHSLALYGWGRIKVEHFRRNIFGNFKPNRAGRLEVEGFVATTEEGNTILVLLSETKDDARQVSAQASEGGLHLITIPYAEGNGGVTGNSALQAFSCSGVFPF